MKPQIPPSELALAFAPLKPVIVKAIGFSTLISLLALMPTVYMLEVYDRVVNSRSGMTLLMLTVLIVLAYAVMELLEKVRGSLMRAAGVQVDEVLSKRIYDAMFQGFLKRQVGGSMQVLNDLKVVREFLANPAHQPRAGLGCCSGCHCPNWRGLHERARHAQAFERSQPQCGGCSAICRSITSQCPCDGVHGYARCCAWPLAKAPTRICRLPGCCI